ncbi:MAG: flagellar basal body P-ring protein FlgI [Planctomycetota bacterium]|jgi:flagellar P-ring protein precursor FlgI
MISGRTALGTILGCAILALGARTACATTVQDLVRVKGHERNTLTGLGIVIGLNGTGDESSRSRLVARPYAALFRELGNPVGLSDDLTEVDSYALVQVTMSVPATGVREGDRLDVSVGTLFNATSLEGGRLVVSMLRLPLPDAPELQPLAMAEGALIVEGDNPRTAVIRRGGQMLADIRTNPVSKVGAMTLVLDDQYAGYPAATAIADAINDEWALDGYSDIAYAEDARNVKVLLPEPDRARPAPFIATLLTIPLDSSLIQTEARIVINEKQGIITFTGDITISPAGITHRGLSISSLTGAAPGGAPGGAPAPAAGPGAGQRWAGLDTTDGTSRSSTRLGELLGAFEQLQVPVEDQIAIIYELQKTGALHAEIISQ